MLQTIENNLHERKIYIVIVNYYIVTRSLHNTMTTQISDKEKEALLILFKDFSSYYNANSLSKLLGISRIGTMKLLKKFKKNNILKDRKIGKSTVYKLNLEDDYVRNMISFLLADEANNFKRWKDEFKGFFKGERIVMLYGSTIKNYEKARDIDIMIVMEKREYKEVAKVIEERQKFLSKKIHSIELIPNDLLKNLQEKQKAVIDIVKNAIILYGQNKYVEIIQNVTSI